MNYPGRVAPVDIHFMPTDSFYLEEAYQRVQFYVPPMGFYLEPWLWYDGDQDGGFNYMDWEAKIVARMSLPAPVTIRFWGDFTPGDGSGTVYAQFRNDSSATINGIAILVITEDSLFYPAPNGANWHNHVPRDYLPDQNGTPISIAPGDSVVVNQSFTTQAVWNDDMCKILAWIQDTVIQADSTYEIWQGGMVPVTELGVEEVISDEPVHTGITAYPNPGSEQVSFAFSIPCGESYTLEIYDVNGRMIKRLSGIAQDKIVRDIWDRTDRMGNRMNAGVYFYQLKSTVSNMTGKVILR